MGLIIVAWKTNLVPQKLCLLDDILFFKAIRVSLFVKFVRLRTYTWNEINLYHLKKANRFANGVTLNKTDISFLGHISGNN